MSEIQGYRGYGGDTGQGKEIYALKFIKFKISFI